MFASQPDLPLDQDSLAGFLHGFLVTGAHLLPPGSLQQQALFPVLGGTVLLARTLPINPGPVTPGRRFIGRLALTLPPEQPADTHTADRPSVHGGLPSRGRGDRAGVLRPRLNSGPPPAGGDDTTGGALDGTLRGLPPRGRGRPGRPVPWPGG